MASWSADTMLGRASPARIRARAACISSRRSLASRMTSPRLKGDASTEYVCAATAVDQVVSHTVNRRATRRPVRLFMTLPHSRASRRAGTHSRPVQVVRNQLTAGTIQIYS
jgi:hypothetical protein